MGICECELSGCRSSKEYNPYNNVLNNWVNNKVEITNWINCLNRNGLKVDQPNPNSAHCDWPIEKQPGYKDYVRTEGFRGSNLINLTTLLYIYKTKI